MIHADSTAYPLLHVELNTFLSYMPVLQGIFSRFSFEFQVPINRISQLLTVLSNQISRLHLSDPIHQKLVQMLTIYCLNFMFLYNLQYRYLVLILKKCVDVTNT